MSENSTLIINLRIGLEISPLSASVLGNIRTRLFSAFGNDNNIKIEDNHHMTLNYIGGISDEEIHKWMRKYETIKKEFQEKFIIDASLPYDDTVHHIKRRKSNINNRIYIVLVPHNISGIYGKYITNENISPHITLLSFEGDSIKDIKKMLEIVKTIRDEEIGNNKIFCDIGEIKFKVRR